MTRRREPRGCRWLPVESPRGHPQRNQSAGRRAPRRDGAAPRVRLRELPRPARGDHRPRDRRRRRARADADRRREVAVLPDPRAGPPGHRRGDLAADRADAGPGPGAAAAGDPRGLPQLHAGPGDQARRGAGVQVRRARPALPRTGAAAHRGDAQAARRREDLGVRDRRGALRVPVGPRLPPRLPRAAGAARAVARRAADRADRHRHPGDAGRDRDQAQAGRRPAVRVVIRPAERAIPDRSEK